MTWLVIVLGGYWGAGLVASKYMMPLAINWVNSWVYSYNKSDIRSFKSSFWALVFGMLWPITLPLVIVHKTAHPSPTELRVQLQENQRLLDQQTIEMERANFAVRRALQNDPLYLGANDRV